MSPGEATDYLVAREQNQKIMRIWRQAQKNLEEGTTGSFRGIMAAHGLEMIDPIAKRLARYAVPIRAQDFDSIDLPEDGESALRRLRKYTAIAIPCWERSRLVGMWIIQPECFGPENGFTFVRLQNHWEYAIGMGNAMRFSQEACFITNDPIVSLRLVTRQLHESSHEPMLVLCPANTHDIRASISPRKIYYLPVSSGGPQAPTWYLRALRVDEAFTVPEWKLKFIPATTWPGSASSKAVIAGLRDLAMPAAQALGAYLLTRPQNEAIKYAAQWGLTTTEQNLVLSYFGGQDNRDLLRIFETETRIATVLIDGKTVMETRRGWTCNERLITDATIQITELRTDTVTGESMVRGTITIANRVLPFEEAYETIRRNTATWLDQFVRMSGEWATVDHKWSGALLRIAREFSKGRLSITTTDKPYGWGVDGILRFPQFVLGPHGLGKAQARVHGPDVPLPTPLDASEKDAFLSQDFCMVVLALLGNLVRTAARLPGHGIVVPSSPHVVERIANAFNLPVQRNPTSLEVTNNATMPLPLMLDWADDSLAGFMRGTGTKHCMMSVDNKTFRLMAAYQDWIRLPVESLGGYESLRWIFLVLPAVLKSELKITEDGLYRDLAKISAQELGLPHNKLTLAGKELDNNWVLSNGSAATCFMRLIHSMVELKQVHPIQTRDGWSIQREELLAAFASPFLPSLDFAKVRQYMADAGMLVGADQNRLEISSIAWDLTRTYTRSMPDAL